jgi:hypothetical protein
VKTKCYSEDVLALLVEGDLPQGKADEIEGHLGRCAECRGVVADLRESQGLFKSLRQEMMPESAINTLRSSVMDAAAQVERPSGLALRVERLVFAGFRRRYAVAGLAIVVVLSALMWRSKSAVKSQPLPTPLPIAAVLPSEPAPIPSAVTQTKVIAKHTIVSKHRVTPNPEPAPEPTQAVTEEPKQIVMKIVTDDPNIIIYWLLDQKGAD